MARFSYTARDGGGQLQAGVEEAASAQALTASLRGRGWLVTDVGPADDALAATSAPRPGWGRLLVRAADVEVSLQQVASMLRAGISLLEALRGASEQASTRALAAVWRDVAERIQQGASLADAMEAQGCFGRLVVQLVRVGEQTGTLSQVFEQAAEALEARRELRSNVVSALAYPAVVLVAAVGVTVFMLVYLIPKLNRFLNALGKKLPPMTQALLDISAWFQANGLTTIVLIAALVTGVLALRSWPPGRLAMDRLLLRVPVIGWVLRLSGTSTFSRSFATLVQSGVNIIDGLGTVEELHGNAYLARQVAAARQHVMRGGALAEPLAAPGGFVPMLPRMVAVGEASGTLDEALIEVNRFSEQQLRRAIKRLALIAEPLVVIVVGGIVGFVYMSFFVALFSAASKR